MMNKFTMIGAAAALATLPMTASAVTIAAGDTIFESFDLLANSSATHDYDSNNTIRVNVIAVSGTGFNDGDDLALVRFGVNTADTAFSDITDADPINSPSTASGVGSIASFVSNGAFTLEFLSTGTAAATPMTYTFTVSQVPVPAAGLLLLGALGGVGALRRRKKA